MDTRLNEEPLNVNPIDHLSPPTAPPLHLHPLFATDHDNTPAPNTGSQTIPAIHVESVNLGGFDGPQDENIDSFRHDVAPPSYEKRRNTKDEDEDVDALIDDLESHGGNEALEGEVDFDIKTGEARPVAEELLQTDIFNGLTYKEVIMRRKKFGFNQMQEEEKSRVLTFLSFFVGPIQFVMEVS